VMTSVRDETLMKENWLDSDGVVAGMGKSDCRDSCLSP